MLSNITDEIRLFFRKDKEPYLCFYRILGFYPRNIEIYQQALLHKSSSVKSGKGKLLNNERLEFLGDAILDAVVADIVYKKFDGKREGFLTNTRSKIVQRETLNRVAVEIGLDKLIKFTLKQSSHNNYMCGNAFEALVGAIYLDRGYMACKRFMEKRIIEPYLNLDAISRKEVNFKSKIIEWSQKNKFEVAFNLTLQSVDNEQNPVFETLITIEQLPGASGKGYSKKESQQAAARLTLEKIKTDPQFIDAIFAAKSLRTTENENPDCKTELPLQRLEEEERYIREEKPLEAFDDTENIIARAEEAAFMQEQEQEQEQQEQACAK